MRVEALDGLRVAKVWLSNAAKQLPTARADAPKETRATVV